jgi:glutathione S-transferase
MLTLYFAPGSSSMAAHIALHEIGAEFDARPLSFARKENRSPAYLALNPEGKVPTLVIDGRPLTEVAGILFYLAKRFPAANLLPADDIEAEARAVSWMAFLAATIHPARRQGIEYARAAYALADRRLGDREWATLFDRRHSPVPPLLAFLQLAQACARPISEPRWALPAHDGPAGSRHDLPHRAGHRL